MEKEKQMNKFKEELKVDIEQNAKNFVKKFSYKDRAEFIKEQKQKKKEQMEDLQFQITAIEKLYRSQGRVLSKEDKEKVIKYIKNNCREEEER